MPRVCEQCGVGTNVGVSRSHSHIGTKRKIKPNLQTVRRNGKRLKVCTSCLKKETKQIA